MSGTVTTLPPPATRDTIKLLRELAKRLERGETPPLMLATASIAGPTGDVGINARSHNISPAGMLICITYLLEAVRVRASLTLGDPDAPEAHRAEDSKAILMANGALYSLRDYAPTPSKPKD